MIDLFHGFPNLQLLFLYSSCVGLVFGWVLWAFEFWLGCSGFWWSNGDKFSNFVVVSLAVVTNCLAYRKTGHLR